MKKKITLIALLSSCFFAMQSIAGEYIMLIGSSLADSTVEKVLTDAGYTVHRGTGTYTGILSQEKLDSLNNAALVIFSRNGASAAHGDGSSTPGIVEQWADVSAPILSLSMWIMRSNRWQWINTTSPACLQSDTIYITDDGADHPIFTNVSIVNGGIPFTIPGVTRNESTTVTPDLTTNASIKILAVDSKADEKRVAIAEWEAGVEFYSGAPAPSSTRMFIAIAEGDNCKQESVRPNVMSAFNGTDQGKKILLNAVAYLMGKPIENSIKPTSKSSISLFPNPASNYIVLSNLKSAVGYKIINVNGAVVLKGVAKNRINVSSLPAGLYVIVTDSGQTAKFMKE
ncbi:MAG: T9SS type A sorting domain-containing protein [Bacteroidales bacterium]|nr:T9SS type A sorting domain-containing protein [Bacteroidales bacterium]